MDADDAKDDELVFVSLYPEPEHEARYEDLLNRPSRRPFEVHVGNGQRVRYYLSMKCDANAIGAVVGELHNCRHCKTRSSAQCGLFGPDGYAIDFGGVDGGKLYSQVEDLRRLSSALDPKGTMIVSRGTLGKMPRVLGVDADTKTAFEHLGLNVATTFLTDTVTMKNYADNLLHKLWNGTMDNRLHAIVDDLQACSLENGKSDTDVIVGTLLDPRLLRTSAFWTYRVQYVLAVQAFAATMKHGTSWGSMSEECKMHVRVFALLYGDSFTHDQNINFQAAGMVVDLVGTPMDRGALIALMNARSSPDTYLVKRVAAQNAACGVKSRFKVSLTWNSTTDMDLCVVTDKGEKINFEIPGSKHGDVRMDYDANRLGLTATSDAVENLTLSDQTPGWYKVYANCYALRGKDWVVPFSVVVELDGRTSVYNNSWCGHERNDNNSNFVHKMILVTTVVVTQEMIDNKPHVDMSFKQAHRFAQLLPRFEELFGEVHTDIVDMDTISGVRHLTTLNTEMLASGSHLNKLRQQTCRVNNKKKKSRHQHALLTRMTDVIKILEEDPCGVTISVQGRSLPPSTLTTHTCNTTVLKPKLIASTYYKKTGGPSQPNRDTKLDQCRFDPGWTSHSGGTMHVNALLEISHFNYSGCFVSLSDTWLPSANNPDWNIGAGMYPTDLLPSCHEFREIWQTHHLHVHPASGGKKLAIGVFLHTGMKYNLTIDGVERMVMI
jgi:hypothetical protein